jgi:hypothetical protein
MRLVRLCFRTEAAWRVVLRENGLFFEFSLCLSRACLGKKMTFIYKWLKKCRFLTVTQPVSTAFTSTLLWKYSRAHVKVIMLSAALLMLVCGCRVLFLPTANFPSSAETLIM